jgi:hypothetical protein
MATVGFFTGLFESGRVLVATEALPELDPEVDPILVSAEKVAAENFAGTAPEFSLPTARWAALLFYRACHSVVCRDIDANTVRHLLQEKCPEAHSPQTDYSADLVFQYLPDVIGMTRAIASGDPVLEQLLALARQWPLSTVGVLDVRPVNVHAFISHPGLRQLYADRIIARRDLARLGEPLVDIAVREALGGFPELCMPIAQHFSKIDSAAPTDKTASVSA